MKIGVAAFVACLGLFATGAQAVDKPVTLEFSSFLPANEKLSLALQEWGRELEKRTNGQVKVNYHPGGTLTPPPQTYDSVVKDIIDVGFGPMGATSGRFPLMEVMDLPLGLNSSYSATMLSNELVKRFKPRELADVKVLFMLSSPPAYIQSRKPVRTLEELQGVKLRALGGTTVKVIQGLGAVPVSLPPTDVYDALSKGVIDGAPVISDALVALKWEDSLKYTTRNMRTSYANNGYFVMNRKRFASLPAAVQKIVDELSDEYVMKMSRLWDEKEADAVAALKAKGHTTITLSAEEEEKWVRRIEPVYEAYVKDKSARGLPAAEALQFSRDWVARKQQ
ncbi:MAG: TRAP transporter substrate-binding protein [Burkholderiaceae bacterium]|nr:TRAP transporter substrate-binding protein [Burkholderiaceae bacterium]